MKSIDTNDFLNEAKFFLRIGKDEIEIRETLKERGLDDVQVNEILSEIKNLNRTQVSPVNRLKSIKQMMFGLVLFFLSWVATYYFMFNNETVGLIFVLILFSSIGLFVYGLINFLRSFLRSVN